MMPCYFWFWRFFHVRLAWNTEKTDLISNYSSNSFTMAML